MNLRIFPLLAAWAACLAALPAAAQNVSGIESSAQPIGRPPKPNPNLPASETAPMPTDRIDKPTTLDDQLGAIRAADPAFNSVIVRDPGVPGDYPMLPPMTLKNVTVGQFLQFVRASYPGVEPMRIDGPTGALYTIRIRMDEDAIRRAAAGQERNRLRLYRLNDIANSLADESLDKDKPRPEKLGEATSQILSLLQTALDQTDADGPCTLKMHEATMTLMFKGSAAKQTVLEEALTTLRPRNSADAFGRPRPTRTSGSNSSPFEASSEYNPRGGIPAERWSYDPARQAEDLHQKVNADIARANAEIAANRAEIAKRSAEIRAQSEAMQKAAATRSTKD